MGIVVPLLMLLTGLAQTGIVVAIVSMFALAGLFIWEHLWVQAGQAVPLS